MTTTVGQGTAANDLRVGIVGGGFMARVHTAAARSAGASVVALASSELTRAQRTARELGIPTAYDTAQAMLESGAVDVVHVCTPNHTHTEYASLVLAAGRHVVCEKPLATTVTDADTLATQASDAGLVATVPFVYRFHPMVRHARQMVRSGQLGIVHTLSGSYLQDWLLQADDDNWRVDPALGGRSRAFADIGSHLTDLIEFISGDRIATITARTRTIHGHRGGRAVATEDLAAVIFETERGVLGSLTVSQVAPGRKNRLYVEISGTSESIAFDQEQPESLWVGDRSGSRRVVRDPGTLAADAARLSHVPAGHPQGYQDAFNAFAADTYAAIRGDVREGLPTFVDGARAVRLTDAVMRSAETASTVGVEPATTVRARGSGEPVAV